MKDGVVVKAYVKPRSKRDAITFLDSIEIETRAPPEQNKANLMVIKLISEKLDLPRSSVRIIRGNSARDKEVLLIGVKLDQLKSLQSNNRNP